MDIMKFSNLDLTKRLKAEIKQENLFARTIVSEILYSKRLLVDHVEVLEICLSDLDAKVTLDKGQHSKLLTIRNMSIVAAGAALQSLVTPRGFKFTLIPTVLAAGAVGGFCLAKQIVSIRNKWTENNLSYLIKSIDSFGNCIKRNITYFNEILVMQSGPEEIVESRQIERAWDCITSTKEVIEILYDATRKMEENYLLQDKYVSLYSFMEELRDTEFFKNNVTHYNPKNIKDFYNIFAYVQSQFLLRLAITVSQTPSADFLRNDVSSIGQLIHEHVNEEETHFKRLTIEMKRRQQIELEELKNAQALQMKSGPVAVLQDSSIKLNGRMLAVADQCQQLDTALQRLTETELKKSNEGKHLMEVANCLRLMESSLSVCCDDFHRLFLVYNRFLSSKLVDKNCLSITQVDLEPNSDETGSNPDESVLRVEISSANNNNFDDFYAYAYKEGDRVVDEKENSRDCNSELLNFEERVTKKRFKPVLSQLKDKIDPIRKEMLEKERKVLESKGIDVDEFLGKEEESEKPDGSDDESEGSADEAEKNSKKAAARQNYDEMRNFLAQKQAVNLFGIVPQEKICGDEDILE